MSPSAASLRKRCSKCGMHESPWVRQISEQLMLREPSASQVLFVTHQQSTNQLFLSSGWDAGAG